MQPIELCRCATHVVLQLYWEEPAVLGKKLSTEFWEPFWHNEDTDNQNPRLFEA